MGCALPYGIAAKLAAPDRPLVALAGDGAMQMNGLAELVTVAARWRDWADPRFVVCVLANRDLAEVSWEQREMEGDPRFADQPGDPRLPLRGLRATCSGCAASGSTTPRRSTPPGTRRWPPTGPS